VAYKDGDDGASKEDTSAGDTEGNDGHQRVPTNHLQFEIEAAVFVLVGPSARPTVGALKLILYVLPRVATIAAPAASVALYNFHYYIQNNNNKNKKSQSSKCFGSLLFLYWIVKTSLGSLKINIYLKIGLEPKVFYSIDTCCRSLVHHTPIY